MFALNSAMSGSRLSTFSWLNVGPKGLAEVRSLMRFQEATCSSTDVSKCTSGGCKRRRYGKKSITSWGVPGGGIKVPARIASAPGVSPNGPTASYIGC
jgi:hypothetical protein